MRQWRVTESQIASLTAVSVSAVAATRAFARFNATLDGARKRETPPHTSAAVVDD